MKIAVIGSGGREHAIIRTLKKSPHVDEILAIPGNGGISCDATCLPHLAATDIAGVVEACRSAAVDFVVVTPDDPLALGMVDALQSVQIPAFGPNQAAARIESSKVFSKNLMQKYGIPTAAYRTFTAAQDAMTYLQDSAFPVVIKADGLALGKGVFICDDLAQAQEALRSLMEDKIFGESGNAVVIEEFLTGPEVSVLAFADGKTVVPMVSSMDHKRAFTGDLGPNTGGMGTIAPNPFYTPEMAQVCYDTIFVPTIRAMQEEGCPFCGCLYFGLMLTPQGPRVIEYNCRFGDPETQVVLPLMESDLFEAMLATTNGTLHQTPIVFADNRHAACIILASDGYPGAYETGKQISGLRADGQPQSPGAIVYHAGSRRQEDAFFTAGGRVLGVMATGRSLFDAIQNSYQAVKTITFSGATFRMDIGARALAKE